MALRHLWRSRGWVIVAGVVSLVAAFFATFNVTGLIPPSAESKQLEYGAASLSVVVDSKESTITPRDTPLTTIAQRAALYAQLLKSQPLKKGISRLTGIPVREFAVNGQSGEQGLTDQANEPEQVQRSAELATENATRLLYFNVSIGYPIINLYAQAPTVGEATGLVEGAAAALKGYVGNLQDNLEIPSADQAKIIRLGTPVGGKIAPGADLGVALVVALAVFILGCLLILFLPLLIDAVRDANDDWDDLHTSPPAASPDDLHGPLDEVNGEARQPYDRSLHR